MHAHRPLLYLITIGIPEDLKCKNPWCDRKRYEDDEISYDFCGKFCRDKFQEMQSNIGGQGGRIIE